MIGAAQEQEREGLDDLPLECAVTLSLEGGNRWGHPSIESKATARYGERDFELAVFSDADPAGRDILAETRRRRELRELVTRVPSGYFDDSETERRRAISREVADRVVPKLRASGWRAELGDGFTADAPIAEVKWIEEIGALEDEAGETSSWFRYSLGVEIEGVTYSLLPILIRALRDRNIDLNLAELARGGGDGLTVDVADGKRIYIPRERLVKWLRPLLELELRGLTNEGELRLAAPLLLELVDVDNRGSIAGAALAARLRGQLASLVELEPTAEPEGFVGELRDYQARGLSWLSFLHKSGFGGILADDMGLGKTIQVLALIQQLKNEGRLPNGEPVLVLAPRSVAENWRREVARFTPELTAHIHLGPKRMRTAAEIRGAADIVITSYQTMLRDTAVFKKIEWTSLVLDEAQAVKNPKTKLRQAIVSLKAVSRICVTGTPIENRLLELWSQIDIAMPGLFGHRRGFIRVFETPIKNGDARALETLRRRMRPFMLRRTKNEVELSLPAKTESIVPVELSGGQREPLRGTSLGSRQERARRARRARRRRIGDDGSGRSTQVAPELLRSPARQSRVGARRRRERKARAAARNARGPRGQRTLCVGVLPV